MNRQCRLGLRIVQLPNFKLGSELARPAIHTQSPTNSPEEDERQDTRNSVIQSPQKTKCMKDRFGETVREFGTLLE